MSYKRLPNWPPAWFWIGGEENKHPKGEVGTLTEVAPSHIQPQHRLFVTMDHEKSHYMGCLYLMTNLFAAKS
jgi:hypothetical protein